MKFSNFPVNRPWKASLCLGIATTLLVSTASAQFFNYTYYTFDELGNGTMQPPGMEFPVTLPSTLAVEPISGMTTLVYTLPMNANAGDVLMIDADGPSDILRFDGEGHLFFFSEREPNELNPDPADVSELPALLTNFTTILEEGAEGNNWGIYAPLVSELPGYGLEPMTMTPPHYTFISDIPEPGALPLLGGVLLWAFGRWRKIRG